MPDFVLCGVALAAGGGGALASEEALAGEVSALAGKYNDPFFDRGAFNEVRRAPTGTPPHKQTH